METFATLCKCGASLVYAYFNEKEYTTGVFLCPKCDKQKIKEAISVDKNTNFSEIQD